MSDYYTVTQFAELYGKDTGNIRRMLINGTLQGEKVGNQWLIPKNVCVPEDKRIKSGEYKRWRQKVALNSKYPLMIRKLHNMCDALEKVYLDSMSEVILYGSYARGKETKESDIDIAIVLKESQTEEQYERMTDIALDYELDLGVTLSIIQIEHSEFMDWKTTIPFYKNVEKEGIVLWKSA